MQLEKGEHSILSYFASSSHAKKAAEELKKAGFIPSEDSVQIDQISRFGLSKNNDQNDLINFAATLSGPVIYSASEGEDGPNPLLAADPSASGMSAPDTVEVSGTNILLTLVTSNENIEKAVKIIKEQGGYV